MPVFPEPPSSGASKLAIIAFGGVWVWIGLVNGYQGIVLQKITRRSTILAEGQEAVQQGLGWLCLAVIAAFLIYKGVSWVDNSDY